MQRNYQLWISLFTKLLIWLYPRSLQTAEHYVLLSVLCCIWILWTLGSVWWPPSNRRESWPQTWDTLLSQLIWNDFWETLIHVKGSCKSCTSCTNPHNGQRPKWHSVWDKASCIQRHMPLIMCTNRVTLKDYSMSDFSNHKKLLY